MLHSCERFDTGGLGGEGVFFPLTEAASGLRRGGAGGGAEEENFAVERT